MIILRQQSDICRIYAENFDWSKIRLHTSCIWRIIHTTQFFIKNQDTEKIEKREIHLDDMLNTTYHVYKEEGAY